jgi:NitT/TauT family transport system permease protein
MPRTDAYEAYLRNMRRRARAVRVCQLMLAVLFFGAWEAAAALRLIDPFIFSRPSRVFLAAVKLAGTGELFAHILVTLGETALGFALSTLIGFAGAALLWWNGFLERVFAPYAVIFNSLPKTALAPVIIVIAGNNPKSVVATAVMTAVIVALMSALGGFMSVEPEKVKLVRSFGGTKAQILMKLVLPASAPALVNTVKINIGLSFVGVVVGEFLVAKAGLGYLIVYGSQIFKMDWVMLSVIVLGLLAAGLYQLVAAAEKRFFGRAAEN